MTRLAGKRAVVTGGGSGIGRGVVEAFTAEGARVVVLDSTVSTTTRESQPWPAGAAFRQCDVTDEAAVEAAIAWAVKDMGGIDVLVNSAGVISQAPVADISLAEWSRVLAVNLTGTFLCCREVVRVMLASGGGGRIVNVASQVAMIGGVELAHYAASKGGVVALTRAMGVELAPHGVLVNAIAPGFIRTPMNANLDAKWHAAKLATLPIGRFGTVEEVAPTAVFLASDDARYYVGQVLSPNGGDAF
jgi:3-oxoacyl-[acyl-carrier protein] reductase